MERANLDTCDTELFSIGDWCVFKCRTGLTGWESGIVHLLKHGSIAKIGYYLTDNDIKNKRCHECSIDVPDDIISVWTLSNFEVIGTKKRWTK